ncbi:hypothetical protein [Litoribacter populi]|uniref:hypothetical protein n=1 Tax=Litoribacter populi TaxID=2598460 RepID=UPI001180E540|nr:hypothetical protein [Litoribacter populi]
MMHELMTIYTALSFLGFGFVVGGSAGLYFGRKFAEWRVIDHVNSKPFDYAFEIVDDLYPESAEMIIKVPEPKVTPDRRRILMKHWSFHRNN